MISALSTPTAVGFLALLAGCVSAPPPVPHASHEEIMAKAGAYNVCLNQAAASLDDGRTDPSIIAVAVRDACGSERVGFYEAISRGDDPMTTALLFQNSEKDEFSAALTAILKRRAALPH